MKRLKIILLFVMVLFLSAAVLPEPVMAAESGQVRPENVVDDAQLLTKEEKNTLSEKMEEISNRLSCELVVVTVWSNQLGSKSTMAYADDFFDYNGYGLGNDRAGVLLLIAMEEDGHGDYWISTSGYGIRALTDAGIEYIGDSFVPYLKDREYAQAFLDFADNCDTFITQAKNGKAYDVGNMPKGALPIKRNIVIALVGGCLISLLITLCMRQKLKSVRPKKSAASYVKAGSMKVTEQKDIYLYRNVKRREKPKDSGGSSTHSSSSGRSHGGGGGSF